MKVCDAARLLEINYENAKAINTVYKKQNRVHRLNEKQIESGSSYSDEIRTSLGKECLNPDDDESHGHP